MKGWIFVVKVFGRIGQIGRNIISGIWECRLGQRQQIEGSMTDDGVDQGIG